MDFLLNATTTGEKLTVMVVAIVLFVAVMGLLLYAVDKPRNVPGWVVFAAFVGPSALLLLFGLIRPAVITIYQSFFDRTGAAFVGFDNYATLFT